MANLSFLSRRNGVVSSAVALSQSHNNGASKRNSFTAAAERLTAKLGKPSGVNAGWQSRGWDLAESIPEVWFAGRWIGRAMGHARLYAGEIQPNGDIEPAPAGHPSHDVVAGIAGGTGPGQSQYLSAWGPHLTVAGEGYTAVLDGQWWVLSTQEIQVDNRGRAKLQVGFDELEMSVDELNSTVFRIWRPSPRRYVEADSPVKASMDVLEELQLLSASVKAVAQSRLAGRGLLLVPQGIRAPTTPGQSDAQDDALAVLQDVMATAIQDPESAAAMVPLMLEVPKEVISEIKHITFESDFDEMLLELRKEAIRRWASAIEIPAEYLLGLGDSNHWSVFQLSREAIQMGVEPHLKTVCDGLTQFVLRPGLSVENANRYVVWYDIEDLKPDIEDENGVGPTTTQMLASAADREPA